MPLSRRHYGCSPIQIRYNGSQTRSETCSDPSNTTNDCYNIALTGCNPAIDLIEELSKIDELAQAYRWSEQLAIHFVILKLEKIVDSRPSYR